MFMLYMKIIIFFTDFSNLFVHKDYVLVVHSFHVCGKGSSSLVVFRVHTCTKKFNKNVIHYAHSSHNTLCCKLTTNQGL